MAARRASKSSAGIRRRLAFKARCLADEVLEGEHQVPERIADLLRGLASELESACSETIDAQRALAHDRACAVQEELQGKRLPRASLVSVFALALEAYDEQANTRGRDPVLEKDLEQVRVFFKLREPKP